MTRPRKHYTAGYRDVAWFIAHAVLVDRRAPDCAQIRGRFPGMSRAAGAKWSRWGRDQLDALNAAHGETNGHN